MPVYLVGFRSKVSTILRTLAIWRDICFLRNAKLHCHFFLGKRTVKKLVVSHFVALSFCHWGFWNSISYLTRVPFFKKRIVRVFRCRNVIVSIKVTITTLYLPCTIEYNPKLTS